jgi:hypothetical protein
MEYCEDGRYKITRPPIWLPTGRYRAKSGRYIAIDNAYLSIAQKADLYSNKGANLVFVSTVEEANTLNASPYNIPKAAMIGSMHPPISILTDFLQAGIKRFNIDEPVTCHKNYGTGFVDSVDAGLAADCKLYVSDYLIVGCSTFQHCGVIHNAISSLISDYAPLVSSKTKFGTHSQWEEMDGVGTLIDPRDQWTQLKNALAGQGKFEHGWVRTIKGVYYIAGYYEQLATSEQMQLIWGHANNVGANTMFVYAEGTDHLFYSNVLDNVLSAGWQVGSWLDREEESVQAQYCCTTPQYEPDSCTFIGLIHSGQFRWA